MGLQPLSELTDAPVETPAQTPPADWGFTRELRSRFRRVCDALATAPARSRDRGGWGSGLIALDPRTKPLDRPAAALDLLDAVVPGTAKAWSGFSVSARKLPFRCDEVSLLALGTGDSVFQLGAPQSGFVCKVERTSLGLQPPELARLARERRDGFSRVLGHYGAVKDVFPGVRFLVVQSPLFGVPAVAALQDFVPGPRRDLFRDVPVAELERLVNERPVLRAQIAGFLRCTITAWNRGGWIVDLGAGNLVLAGEGGGARLVYLAVDMKQVAALRGTIREGMYKVLVHRMVELLGSTLGD